MKEEEEIQLQEEEVNSEAPARILTPPIIEDEGTLQAVAA